MCDPIFESALARFRARTDDSDVDWPVLEKTFHRGERLDALAELLDPRGDRVQSAAYLLSEMPMTGLPLLEHGVALLTHENGRVRFHALGAVAYFLGKTDRPRGEAVIASMIDDPDENVRWRATDLREAYAGRRIRVPRRDQR